MFGRVVHNRNVAAVRNTLSRPTANGARTWNVLYYSARDLD